MSALDKASPKISTVANGWNNGPPLSINGVKPPIVVQVVISIGLTYDPKRSLKEQFYTIIRGEMDIILSKKFMNLARIVTSELIRTPATAHTFWEDVHKKKTATFFWLKDAIADGRLNIPSTEVATRQLGGLLKEFIFWPQLLGGQKAPSKAELDEIVSSAIDMFLNYYEVK